ncbi:MULTISPECIES: hypothetical protein [Olivibacter]|uniref:Phage major capsid protein n=1 Tax=Olivibacter jilunii TaxID=985016 RepID=A0ABW6AYT4_9SPHI
MKKIEIKWTSLFYNVVIAALVLVSFFGLSVETLASSVAVGVTSGVALGFVSSKGLAFMAVQVEIWRSHIEESLFADNTFLNHISDVDQDNILNGKIVHIPQSGGGSKVVKNRTVKPAQVRTRTDDEVLYRIDEYTSDPVHISDAETKELSYDKRDSVIREELDALANETAEGVLENIISSPVGGSNSIPADNILLTEGEAVATGLAGATGNRKAYGLSDLQKMRNFMKKQNAWREGQMYALLTADAETQMFPANSMVTATYMAQVTEEERRNGVMYKCQGWKLLSRSSVYVLDENGNFKTYGSEILPTDDEGCLFWNKNMVEKALGQTVFFDDMGNPVWYGDIYSFLVRIGARAKRKNYEGVGVLRQVVSV